jgi:protein-S-isoprenylcysteine O-methyltransferase Ste14
LPVAKVIAFVLASCGILYLSRKSLLDVRSHGFYRCLAWEAIVVVLLLNLDKWFLRPTSGYQIVSWLLLSCSLLLVVAGAVSLKQLGRPDARRQDAQLFGLEKTTRLVTVAAYRFIRHPLYGSLLFLAWGAFFKDPSPAGASAASAATLFLLATAKAEERENLRYFGPAYAEYVKRTKMFVPFLF